MMLLLAFQNSASLTYIPLTTGFPIKGAKSHSGGRKLTVEKNTDALTSGFVWFLKYSIISHIATGAVLATNQIHTQKNMSCDH